MFQQDTPCASVITLSWEQDYHNGLNFKMFTLVLLRVPGKHGTLCVSFTDNLMDHAAVLTHTHTHTHTHSCKYIVHYILSWLHVTPSHFLLEPFSTNYTIISIANWRSPLLVHIRAL